MQQRHKIALALMQDIGNVIEYLQRELRFLETEGMHNDVLFRQGINSIYRSIDSLRRGMWDVEDRYEQAQKEGSEARDEAIVHGVVSREGKVS